MLPSWLIASLLLVPAVVYLAYRAYVTLAERLENERRHARQMSELHLATIEALALAIDAKDQTAHNHLGRMQLYATALARALGMSASDVQAVETAALLHDIGKLAVPEHILAKPGPLTAEEFQKVRIHPQVGADIIAAVPFPYPVSPLILAHHERWDGRGYPGGLSAEDIPLPARIVAVADVYDSLTNDRPYRQAWPEESALEEIDRSAGTQFDPRVVGAFLRVHTQIETVD